MNSENKCIICGKTRDEMYPPPKIQGISPEDQKRLDEAKDGEMIPLSSPYPLVIDIRPCFWYIDLGNPEHTQFHICPPCLKKAIPILASFIKSKLAEPSENIKIENPNLVEPCTED